MIITLTANTQNDCTVSKVVIGTVANTYCYPVSVTYNDGKSFDVQVKAGDEDKAIALFKRLCPDLTIAKSDKAEMAKSFKESKAIKEATVCIANTDIDLMKADIANKAYGLEVIMDGDTHSVQLSGSQEAIDKFLADTNLTDKVLAC